MAEFKGLWKLDKYESLDPVRTEWRPAANRTGYTGYILYDGLGHMGVQLIPPGVNTFDINKNIDSLHIEEIKAIANFHFKSFEYFGNCKITDGGKSIEHFRLSSNNPKEPGTSVKRDFEFRGDTLILTAKEAIGGLKTRLRWVRS